MGGGVLRAHKADISRQQIDVKGFLFKAIEDTAHRKIMLKGYPVRQKVLPKGPDQAQYVTSWEWECVGLSHCFTLHRPLYLSFCRIQMLTV